MTPERLRLATLAALLAPERAVTLLARVSGADGPELVAFATALSARERGERLRALAGTLASPPPAARRARALTLAAAERPRIAGRLLATGGAPAVPGPVAAALERLLRERLAT